MDKFVAVAAAVLAERAMMSPDAPEPQIAATALLGLWRIQFQALPKYLDGTRTPAQVHQAVTADVHRAAQLIDTGLSSFAAGTPGTGRRQGTPVAATPKRGSGQPGSVVNTGDAGGELTAEVERLT